MPSSASTVFSKSRWPSGTEAIVSTRRSTSSMAAATPLRMASASIADQFGVVELSHASADSLGFPGAAAMTEVEASGMQDFGDDLKRFNDARARPIDVLIAVDQSDAAFAHCAQRRPARIGAQQLRIATRLREAVAAWSDDDDVGVGGLEVVDAEVQRLAAGSPDDWSASSQLDQLHRPSARRSSVGRPTRRRRRWAALLSLEPAPRSR